MGDFEVGAVIMMLDKMIPDAGKDSGFWILERVLDS